MTSGTKHSVDVGPQPWPPLSLPCTGFAMHQGLQLIKNLAAEQASALRRSCSAQFVSSKPPYCTVCVWRASCLCLCTSASCRAEESWKKGVRCSLLLHAELDTIAFRCGSHLGYHSVGTQLSCLHSFACLPDSPLSLYRLSRPPAACPGAWLCKHLLVTYMQVFRWEATLRLHEEETWNNDNL